jgi:hypothetical protein
VGTGVRNVAYINYICSGGFNLDIMVVGGYSLDLYCDNTEEGAHPHDYFDWENYVKFPLTYFEDAPNGYYKTRQMARKDGWILKRDGTAICPRCSKKNKL